MSKRKDCIMVNQFWIACKGDKRYVILGKDEKDVKHLLREHLRCKQLRGFKYLWLSRESRGVITEYSLPIQEASNDQE